MSVEQGDQFVVEKDEEGIIGHHQAQLRPWTVSTLLLREWPTEMAEWRRLCFSSVSVWWLVCGANHGGGVAGWPKPHLIRMDRNVCFVLCLNVFDLPPSDT